MTYNDNLILRYLYGLDEKARLSTEYKTLLMDVGSEIDEDRESAINELYGLKNNCKKLAVLSKKFVDAMDKSYMKFTQFHMDILSECDGENGVIKVRIFRRFFCRLLYKECLIIFMGVSQSAKIQIIRVSSLMFRF